MFKVRVLNSMAYQAQRQLHQWGRECDNGEADGLWVRNADVNLDEYEFLQVVTRAGVGVNNIPVEQATDRGICVMNTPGANAVSVAELLFFTLGVSMRRIDKAINFLTTLKGLDKDKLTEAVETNKNRFAGFELRGKTLGVIGLGHIGVQVANRGLALGMEVLGFEVSRSPTMMHQLDQRVTLVDKDTLLQNCNVITVHVPLCDATRNLIGIDELLKMPNCTRIMNFSRGAVIDSAAVIRALNRGDLAGYVTDFPEPDLLSHDKILCLPHLGASTEESEINCATMAVAQMRDYLRYGHVVNSVNFPTVVKEVGSSTRYRLTVVNYDMPNVIGEIGNALGRAGVNISGCAHESNGKIGYGVFDVSEEVPDELMRQILSQNHMIRTRMIKFK